MIAKSKQLEIDKTEKVILKLSGLSSVTQPLEIVALIKSIIPEYISNNSTYEVLDSNTKSR